MTKKQLIGAMDRTINSLLKGEINNELLQLKPEDFSDDELGLLAHSILKLNDLYAYEGRQAQNKPAPKSDCLETAPSKFGVLTGSKYSEQINPDKHNMEEAVNSDPYANLFSRMEKALAIFKIVYDEQGGPVDYVFDEVNEFFSSSTGYKLSDVIGKSIRTVFEGTSKLWMDTAGMVASDGVTRQIEYYSYELNRYINVIIFHTSQSKLATITTDVSKWKEDEKRLKLFSYVLQSVSECVSVTDMDDNLIFVNEAFIKTYGYSEDELIGRKISMVRASGSGQDDVEEIYPRTIETGGWSGYLWNKKKDNTNFYIKLFTSIVRDTENKPVALVGVARDITAQKAVRDSLKNYVSLLNATLNSTVDGIVAVNLKGKIVIYNEQFLKTINLTHVQLNSYGDEILDRFISGMLLKPDNFLKKLRTLESLPEEKSYDILQLKDGRTFEIFSRPQLINKKAVGRVWSFRDITKHERLNRELLESRAKLSLAMDLVKIAHWEYDVNTDMFTFNDRFYELYGTSLETERSYQMSGTQYFEKFIHPDDREFSYKEIKNGSMSEYSSLGRPFEHRILHGSGHTRNIVVRFAGITDNDGNIIKLYGANQDITDERKIVEALLKSESKYRKIFEYINDVFYITSKEGIITEISHSVKRLLGYSQKELIGKNAGLLYFNPDDRKLLVDSIMRDKFVTDFEVEMKDKSGKPVYLSVSSHMMEDENGGFAGIEGTMRDISERKKNEEKIKQINAELRDLNATKDKFFSIIAHDLKGPFQGLLGYTDLLLDEFQTLSEEEKLEFIKSTNNLTHSAYKLLENLLHWSRLQTGKIVFNSDFFNLNEALKSTIFLMSEAAREKDITVKPAIDKKIFVIADLDMLQAIIRNLVSNSIKFTMPGGVIMVSAEELTDKIKICVQDNGIGMNKVNLDKLFRIEKSFSTKGTANEEGTGLGLLLCKEMIDMHKGEIWAESEPGKGTKFFITIPSERSS